MGISKVRKWTTHALDKLFPLVTYHPLGKPNLPKAYILVHLLRIFCVKRAPTTTHLKEQYTQTPKVDNLGVAVLVEEDLWREVLCCAAKGSGEFVGAQIGFGESKVAEGEVACCVEEDIFGFEVTREEVKSCLGTKKDNRPIDNVILVQMLQGQYELCNIKLGPFLSKPRFSLQVPEQFAATLEIGDQIEIGVCLETKLETDEEGGFEGTLEDLAFADGVCDFFFGDDFLL